MQIIKALHGMHSLYKYNNIRSFLNPFSFKSYYLLEVVDFCVVQLQQWTSLICLDT